jgi:acyl-CoA dehydrogenase
MIIYGQGAIRCHPWVQKLIEAIAAKDLAAFDRCTFGYINFVFTRGVRALLLGLTGARLAKAPDSELRRQYQHLTRFASAFAFISDLCMATLGGSLKRREKISGRLADALAWQYLAAATLKRYHDEPKLASNYDLARWGAALALFRTQEALRGVLDNLPSPFAVGFARLLVFPLGARFRPPSDLLGQRAARAILEDREARIHLTEDIHVPGPHEPGLGELEAALDKAVRALPVETKLRDAVRAGQLDRAPKDELDQRALAAGIISAEELAALSEANEARDAVVQVDAFDADTYRQLR